MPLSTVISRPTSALIVAHLSKLTPHSSTTRNECICKSNLTDVSTVVKSSFLRKTMVSMCELTQGRNPTSANFVANVSAVATT